MHITKEKFFIALDICIYLFIGEQKQNIRLFITKDKSDIKHVHMI